MPTTLSCWRLRYGEDGTDPVSVFGQLDTDHHGNWIQIGMSEPQPGSYFGVEPTDENVQCAMMGHPPAPEGGYWKVRVIAVDAAGVWSEPSSVGAILPVPEMGVEALLLVGVAFLAWLMPSASPRPGRRRHSR